MTECPLCQTACPPQAHFCPKCGHALGQVAATPAPPALREMVDTLLPMSGPPAGSVPASSPTASAAPAVRRSSATLLGVLVALVLVLAAMIGGGMLWLSRLSGGPDTPANATAKPAPAPIELAPGLNPADKTLPARPPVAGNASGPLSAAQEAEQLLPPRADTSAASKPADPGAAARSGQQGHDIAPAKPVVRPAVAAETATAPAPVPHETPASSSKALAGVPKPASPDTRANPPADATSAPAKPANAQSSHGNALHEDILRRKEALKRQMGVE